MSSGTLIVDRDTNARAVYSVDPATGQPIGTGTSAQQVQGTSASGTTATGNTLRDGGVYNSTAPTLTNGQLGDLQLENRGALKVKIGGASATGGDGQGNNTLLFGALENNNAGLPVFGAWYFNGTSWDRARGDANGMYTQSGTLPAGTDRSGTATTSSTTTIAANAARRGLNIQNIGANNIGVNEFGGTAAIGTAGTYTLTPGSSMNVRTNRAITMIAATASTAFTATEF